MVHFKLLTLPLAQGADAEPDWRRPRTRSCREPFLLTPAAGPSQMSTPARPEGVEFRASETPPAGTQVPKRRFGRTEIMMPILTCGGCVVFRSSF